METSQKSPVEEVVFDFLDSASIKFLITMQKHLPQWFKTDGKWSLTDTSDAVRWSCQNKISLFEVSAYLLYVTWRSFILAEQSQEAMQATLDHCALRVVEYVFERSGLNNAEIEEISAIIWNDRARQYQSYAKRQSSIAYFHAPLIWPSLLWNQIRISVGATKVSPGVPGIIIDGNSFDCLGDLHVMIDQLAKLVMHVADALQRAFSGTKDYRVKGTDEIKRLLYATNT